MTALLPRPSVLSVSASLPTATRFAPARRALAPLLIGLAGIVMSLIGLTSASVWYDEAATITATTRSWPQLAEMLGTVDAVHGAYYVGIHLLFDVVGYSPLALRLPSAIAVGLTAAALVLFARQFGRPRLGVIAAVVFLLLPRTTWMATEGRSYALTALLALVMTMALAHAAHSRRRRSWVVYGAIALVGCVVFIYLALVVVAHGISMALWLRSRSGAARLHARRWLLAAAAAALALLPFAAIVIGESGQVSWLRAPTPQQVLLAQWFYTSVPFAIAGWALVIAGGVFLSRSPGFSVGLLALPAIIAPAVLLVAVSLAMPLYTPRYLSICLPFVAIAAAAALDRLLAGRRVAIAIAVLLALALPQVIEQRQPEARDESAWSQVADYLAADRGDARVAIIYGAVYGHPTATARVMAHAYPEAFADTVDVTLATPAAETGRLWETTAPLASELGRLDGVEVTYLVTSTSRDLRAQTTSTMIAAGWVPVAGERFTHVNLIRYEPALSYSS
jgi:mannosyltransferase